MKTPIRAVIEQWKLFHLRLAFQTIRRIGLLAIGMAALVNLGTTELRAAGVVTNCTDQVFRAALAGGGTINFTGACSLTLTGSVNILVNTTIETGGNNVTISGGDANRIFTVASGVSFTINGLTLSNGRSTNGGAIYINSNATVQLTNCSLSANNALGLGGTAGSNGQNSSGIGQNGGSGTSGTVGLGGAIYNLGSLVLQTCILSTNSAIGGVGGNGGKGGDGGFQGGNGGVGAGGGTGLGGSIHNLGTLLARDCTFANNTASGGLGGAGGLNGSGPFPGLAGTGAAGGFGGGAGIYATQTVSLINCTFAANQALGGNSANGGTLANSNGSPGARGADSFGGGLYNTGFMVATNCTFYNNNVTAGNGGNGGNGDFYGGNGGDGGTGSGGGLYSAGTVTLVNTTFSNGSAVGGTNGVAGVGNYAGVNGNPGQALGGNVACGSGLFTLKNSILATNLSGGSGYGAVTDAGNNICADGSLSFGTNSLANTDPRLEGLAANGGLTITLRPLPGSPAIDAGNNAASPNFDQRGFTRPAGNKVDIGAVEATPPVISGAPQSQTNSTGSNVTFVVTAVGDATLVYQWQYNAANISGATTASYPLNNITTNNAGNYQVVVSNGYGANTSAVATLTVLVPPSVTQQPADLTVLTGGSGSFGVTVNGTAPLSYQWQFNGTNISGATAANFAFTNAQASNAGGYAVIVTNIAGSVTSTSAKLKVLISPNLTGVSGSRTNFNFNYPTVVGSTYVIEYKANLNDANWTPIATNTGNGNLLNYFEVPAGLSNRFYRVVVR